MERILIIGGNGSGKTTFALELASKLNLPLTHLDKLYWRDNWQSVGREEFDRRLMAELCKPRWIIDGNITRTLPLRLKYCDTVIWFDFPGATCFIGALRRMIANYGRSRPDMGGYCPERINREKLSFLFGILKETGSLHDRFLDILKDAPHVNVIVLHRRRDVKRFLSEL